jgi:DNA-binding PadR family transcriptional regulator
VDALVERQDARRSQLDYAVLGQLLQRPSYGYAIFERLGSPSISQSAVYKALSRLNVAGLIERVRTPIRLAPEGRPRLHYQATAEGIEEYQAWVADLPGDYGLAARIAASGMRDIQMVMALLDRCQRDCLAQLQPPVMREQHGDSLAQLLHALAEDERAGLLRSQLAWIGQARERILAYAEEGS